MTTQAAEPEPTMIPNPRTREAQKPRGRPGRATPFEEVNRFFNEAADKIGLAEELKPLLITPYREMRVEV